MWFDIMYEKIRNISTDNMTLYEALIQTMSREIFNLDWNRAIFNLIHALPITVKVIILA